MSNIDEEFDYYLQHQDELVELYNGKYIVIKSLKIIGIYDSELEAINKTTKKGHELGTFLVQKCEPGQDSYTQTFYSRASFTNI